MNYMKLMKIVKELGYSRFLPDSEELLKFILDKKLVEFYGAFNISAWTLDNLFILFDQSDDINNFHFLRKYNFQKQDRTFVYSLANELVKKRFGDLFVDLLCEFLKNDREVCDILINNIKDMDLSANKFVWLINNSGYRFQILKKAIEENREDLIAMLFSFRITFNESEIELIANCAPEFVNYLSFFNIEVSIDYYKNNTKIFELLFMNGYSNALRCIGYFGYDNVKNFISTNGKVLEKAIEYARTENHDYVGDLLRISMVRKNKDLLKIVLEREFLDLLNYFSVEAWSIENQIFYYNMLSEREGMPKLSYMFNRSYPYLYYKASYEFKEPYLGNANFDKIDDNKNFQDFKTSFSIGKSLVDEEIAPNDYVKRFYRLIFETKSVNVHRLIMAFTSNDISNLKNIFDDNGFTDYFRSHILFDVDYICSNSASIIDEHPSLEYATYVKMLNLNNNMKKYLFCLNINANNIREYISNNTFTRKAIDRLMKDKDGILALVDLNSLGYDLGLTKLEAIILDRYVKIASEKQKSYFIDFCISHKNELKEEHIDRVFSLINKVVNSNSFEIRKQADNIVLKLMNKEDCIEKFNDLESIFIDGASPEFIKRFAVYKILYGDVEISKDSSVTSPILKSVSREEADKIILDDLLRISLATNSLNIQRYLQILSDGYNVYYGVDNNTAISDEDRKLIHEYRIRLEFIVKHFIELDYVSVDDDYQTIFNIERACLRKNGMQRIPDNFHWPMFNDLILKEISCGFDNMFLLQAYVAKHSILKTVFEERKQVRDEKLTIKEGDFLKGIDSAFLDNIFSYGSLSIEFLGEDASQDLTHLDTDMSLIDKDVSSVPDLLSMSLTACSFGDMKLLISKEYIDYFGETVLTVDKDGKKEFTEEDKKKTELFCYSAGNNHYCIRTGFPITYVKAIIASRNFDRARFIVLKNNFFVPIYDTKGELIFGFEDYYRERKAMDGLSYYGCSDYKISENLYTEDIDNIAKELQNSRMDATLKRNAIYSKVLPIFNKYFTGVKDYIDSSVKKGVAEIIDTGSTGRGTNVYGDGDFDFIVRLDKEFLESSRFKEFSREIYQAFGKSTGDERIIRLDNVQIDGVNDPLKIEITFIDKNSKVEYSTDMCIKDRLATIEKLYPDQYPLVIANILYAKKFFKDIGVYKRFEGGLGGVGVENFVLQHNGSFHDAATHFVTVADECGLKLEEFKKKFHVYDFGKNYYAYASINSAVSFPYDNFINNITSTSFPKLVSALKGYLGYEMAQKNMQY